MRRVLRLMERTGWGYQECARCVLSMNYDAIEAHIKKRREDDVREDDVVADRDSPPASSSRSDPRNDQRSDQR